MTDAPDLTDYLVIHQCLRIAPHRMAAALSELPDGARDQAQALARYWAGFAGEVLTHHTIEDDHIFPRLVERVPAAAEHIARIDGDHHHLDELMDACGTAIERLAAHPTTGAADDAATVMRELAAHMDAHLDFEDEDILPLFPRHFTVAEYEAMSDVARKAVGLGKQAAFTIPFVAYWARPGDLAKLLADAPLPIRILLRLTRGRHARLTQRALGRAAAPQEVAR